MDSRLALELLAILALVLANGFFALAEFSIIASRRSKLHQKAIEGKRGAALAERLRAQPERFLATIQVGITLVAVGVGVFSGATIVDRLATLVALIPVEVIAGAATPAAMALVVLLVTALSVVVGELVPKYLALSFPERYARRIARPINWFIALTSVFSRMLAGLAGLLVRLLGVRRDSAREAVSEEEINQMLVEGRDKGVFDETERTFVRAVFDFADSTVRRAMTPRTDVIGMPIDIDPRKALQLIVEHGYSRYPIYESTIDRVVGVIYTKDILTRGVDPNRIDIEKLKRKPLFVPDSMPLARLLREFQKGRTHMAIVLDEFGGTAGIISLEDVLEELVGEIQDEYDFEVAPLVVHSESIAYANGSVWPGEVNELLGVNLPEDQADTLAGLFMETVGRMPQKHESIEIADTRLTVLAKDENRILRLKVEKVTD
jgi:putative hemolysin